MSLSSCEAGFFLLQKQQQQQQKTKKENKIPEEMNQLLCPAENDLK